MTTTRAGSLGTYMIVLPGQGFVKVSVTARD